MTVVSGITVSQAPGYSPSGTALECQLRTYARTSISVLLTDNMGAYSSAIFTGKSHINDGSVDIDFSDDALYAPYTRELVDPIFTQVWRNSR